MFLSSPVFNLKAIEFGAFFAYFHLFRDLKGIQLFQKYAKTFLFDKLSHKKNRLKIALQVSKLGFSPIVMPELTLSRNFAKLNAASTEREKGLWVEAKLL